MFDITREVQQAARDRAGSGRNFSDEALQKMADQLAGAVRGDVAGLRAQVDELEKQKATLEIEAEVQKELALNKRSRMDFEPGTTNLSEQESRDAALAAQLPLIIKKVMERRQHEASHVAAAPAGITGWAREGTPMVGFF